MIGILDIETVAPSYDGEGFPPVEGFIEWAGFRLLITRVTLYPGASHLCGYVDVPPGHWAHGDPCVYVDVHGGITYARETEDGWWRVGFDCNHFGDTPARWTKAAVAQELYKFADWLGREER